jgi:hypothetical protein
VLVTLAANPSDAAAATKALAQIHQHLGLSEAQALPRLLSLKSLPKADLAFFQAHGAQLGAAQKSNPGEWRHWWWVCVAGELLFLPLILIMAGRWRPKSAKRDADEHEKRVAEELAKLAQSPESRVLVR